MYVNKDLAGIHLVYYVAIPEYSYNRFLWILNDVMCVRYRL